MRSIAGLIVFTLCFFAQLQAQRSRYATLKGTVIDSASHQPIEAATVSVFLIADSSLITYAITNKKGEFLIKEIPQSKPCRVMVTYSGLNTYMQDFIISPETKELMISTVQLRKAYDQLDEVIVAARRPPVLFKKDTIEFNAASFKTPVNGVMEDLLRLLPGLEVDEAGNITVHGKRVSKITVDGKDFFGQDFKIASKNLPRDIIDKVQVVDFKTREAMFNKTVTGIEEKAINITLKKDKKRGVFGRASAGYGTDKRYESGASLNYMSGPLMLNFIGNVNNINRTNLSEGDLSSGKPDGNFGTGARGITVTKGAGLNVGNEFSKELRMNGSYFYDNRHTLNAITARRQNFLPDTSFLHNAASQTANDIGGHRVNLDINYSPDSTTQLNLKVIYKAAKENSATSNEAASTTLGGETINTADNGFTSQSSAKNTDMELFVGRRLKKRGRAFSLNLNYNDGNRSAFNTNKGNIVFYKPGGGNQEEALDQKSKVADDNKRAGLSATFTEPLSKAISMVFRYGYLYTSGRADKRTHRLNPLTGRYDELDTLFSNAFRNRQWTHTPDWSVNYNTNKLNVTMGAGLQWLQQENRSDQAKNVLKQHYTNLFPLTRIRYQFSKTGNLNLSYYGRSQQPSMEQLQPVPDNRNTLYIKLGNPDLKPSFFHNVDLNVQQYNTKGYWSLGLGLAIVQNQMVDDTWFDSVQITRPVNSNGNYTLSVNMGFSRTWRKKNWSLRLALHNNGYYNRNIAFFNKAENTTQTYTFGQRVGLTYTYKDLLTLAPAFIIRYLDNRYSRQQTQHTENITKTLTVNAFVNWPKRFILEHNIQNIYNSRTAPGFPKGATLWNMAVNYQLFKDRQSIFRLSVYDLLKQNTSIYRAITPTYIEDSREQVLQQYFLLSFIYNLKQLGK